MINFNELNKSFHRLDRISRMESLPTEFRLKTGYKPYDILNKSNTVEKCFQYLFKNKKFLISVSKAFCPIFGETNANWELAILEDDQKTIKTDFRNLKSKVSKLFKDDEIISGLSDDDVNKILKLLGFKKEKNKKKKTKMGLIRRRRKIGNSIIGKRAAKGLNGDSFEIDGGIDLLSNCGLPFCNVPTERTEEEKEVLKELVRKSLDGFLSRQ